MFPQLLTLTPILLFCHPVLELLMRLMACVDHVPMASGTPAGFPLAPRPLPPPGSLLLDAWRWLEVGGGGRQAFIPVLTRGAISSTSICPANKWMDS